MAAQMTLPKRGAGYPTRPPFFFHRFARLLGKVCAAQHVGPDGAWFLTYMAATEDSAKYRHAVAWTDEQLSPLVGMSPSKLKRIRAKCIAHGWLHYEQGFKGVPSLYWVLVPPCYDICDGQYLDDELAKSLRIRGHFELESGPNPDRKRTECELESGPKADASIPLPQPTSTTVTFAADGGGDLKKAEQAFEPAHAMGTHVAPTENEPLRSFLPNAEQLAELQTRLRAVGIDLVDATLAAALSVGHSVESILRVIAHAAERPGWWGGGAVRLRLTRSDSVQLPLDRGWPQPDPRAKSRWESQQRKELAAQSLDALTQPKASTPATQQEWDFEALERQHGGRIDASSIDELTELLSGEFLRQQLRRNRDGVDGRSTPMIRQQLLKAFAALDAQLAGK